MFRFIAFLNSQTPDATGADYLSRIRAELQASSDEWSLRTADSHLLLLTTGGTPSSYKTYKIADQGVILGTLFCSHDTRRPAPEFLDVRDNESVATQYWGRYVGFLRGQNGGCKVLRDPSAEIPCYFAAAAPGIVVVFSHLEDYLKVAPHPISINWRFISLYLQRHRVISTDTGFREITQILGGQCVEFRGSNRSSALFWNPVDIASAPAVEDIHEASSSLERVTRDCVLARASSYNSLVHQVSGGLDSAIVLACLNDCDPTTRIVCMNMFLTAAEGDERAFARSAAQRSERELVEIAQDPFAKPLEDMLLARSIPTPKLALVQSDAEDQRERLVRKLNAQAIMTGQGGDHLFQRRRDNLVASEFLHRHGIGIQLIQRILENSRMTGHSVWSVGAACLRYGLLRSQFDPYTNAYRMSLLTEDAQRSTMDCERRHPCLPLNTPLPAAKLQHVHDVIDSVACNMYECRFADVIHPLISQPIMECTLRIPTYLLSYGGTDRGLARKAFARDLPPEIVRRTSKGGFTSFWHNLILHNAPFVSSFLRHGELVKSGILDPQRLDAALTDRSLVLNRHWHELPVALLAEAWLQQSA
jgi:asparagine synthase (glutamine-hydrolysing)